MYTVFKHSRSWASMRGHLIRTGPTSGWWNGGVGEMLPSRGNPAANHTGLFSCLRCCFLYNASFKECPPNKKTDMNALRSHQPAALSIIPADMPLHSDHGSLTFRLGYPFLLNLINGFVCMYVFFRTGINILVFLSGV